MIVVVELANTSLIGHDQTYATHGLHGNYINHNAHAYASPAYPEIHHRAPYYSSVLNNYPTSHNKIGSSVTYHGHHSKLVPSNYIETHHNPNVVYFTQPTPLPSYHNPLLLVPQKFHYVVHDYNHPTQEQASHKEETVEIDSNGSADFEDRTEAIEVDNSGTAESPQPKNTRKVLVRRPAVQKHFFDIEEHIVVRQVGSALLELDEAKSKVEAFKRLNLEDIGAHPSAKDFNYGEFEIVESDSKPKDNIKYVAARDFLQKNSTKSTNSTASNISTDNRLDLEEFLKNTFDTTVAPELQPATEKSDMNDSKQKPQDPIVFH